MIDPVNVKRLLANTIFVQQVFVLAASSFNKIALLPAVCVLLTKHVEQTTVLIIEKGKNSKNCLCLRFL